MSDQNDETQNYALMVLAGVVTLVIAGVLGLAVTKGSGSGSGGMTAANAAAAQIVAGAPEGRVYFAIGSDALPAESSAVLVKVADAARMESGKVVLISGFHDASGDAAANAELAKKRALAVRHALEANGVAPDRLVMDKPLLTSGGADAREARRVEMRLR
ncbi:MAG: OmpA family protein [Rhizobiales bacterium]|nr:OmpA family protein [Rhizobacter sp.]